jgi:hypothetical protein
MWRRAKLRRMKWKGCVAYVGKPEMLTELMLENLKGKENLEDLDLSGSIMRVCLKYTV